MSNKGPARVGIAACLRQLQRPDEARGILHGVRRQPPDELAAAFRDVGDSAEISRTAVNAELGRLEFSAGNFEEAARWLEAALADNPRDWKVRYSLATALQRLRKTDEAKRHFDRVKQTKDALVKADNCLDQLRRKPEDVESRYVLGTVFLEHVSEEQGVVWLLSALSYDAGHQPTHRALAEYYGSKAKEDPRYRELAERHSRLAGGGRDAD
jgi:tetratricopeptide (TPR) repeat protein